MISTKPVEIPRSYYSSLDVFNILQIILKNMNVNKFIKSASVKSSRAVGVPRSEIVNHENLYYSVIYCYIATTMPKIIFKIDPEVHLENQLKVDIVLQNEDVKCAIEIVAHVEPAVVVEHINKTVKYKKLLNVKHAFVIHFTTSPDEKMEIYKNLVHSEVTVLHVQHSPTFDTIKLYKNLDDPIIIRRTGDQ